MWEWLELVWYVMSSSAVALGWFGDEKPPPPLEEPTPWRCGADRSVIDRFGVSSSGMWDLVTRDKKHILFFERKDGYTLHYDIDDKNDVPRVSFRTRLVPPREVEEEMTLHAKSQQQLWDLRIHEKAMYTYLLRHSDYLERV